MTFSTQTFLPLITNDNRVIGVAPIGQTTFDGTETSVTIGSGSYPVRACSPVAKLGGLVQNRPVVNYMGIVVSPTDERQGNYGIQALQAFLPKFRWNTNPGSANMDVNNNNLFYLLQGKPIDGVVVVPSIVTTITRSGSVATATTASAHGLATGDASTVSGATQAAYNGTFIVTVTDATHFTYAVSGSPATPATGSIVSSRASGSFTTASNGSVSVEWALNFNYNSEYAFFDANWVTLLNAKASDSKAVSITLGSPTSDPSNGLVKAFVVSGYPAIINDTVQLNTLRFVKITEEPIPAGSYTWPATISNADGSTVSVTLTVVNR